MRHHAIRAKPCNALGIVLVVILDALHRPARHVESLRNREFHKLALVVGGIAVEHVYFVDPCALRGDCVEYCICAEVSVPLVEIGDSEIPCRHCPVSSGKFMRILLDSVLVLVLCPYVILHNLIAVRSRLLWRDERRWIVRMAAEHEVVGILLSGLVACPLEFHTIYCVLLILPVLVSPRLFACIPGHVDPYRFLVELILHSRGNNLYLNAESFVEDRLLVMAGDILNWIIDPCTFAERIRILERQFRSHRLGYHNLINENTLNRGGVLRAVFAERLTRVLLVLTALRRTPSCKAQRLIVGLRSRYAPQERLEHRCACSNLDVCENIPLRIVLFTRIGTGRNRHPAAILTVGIRNASLEHHSANAVREAGRLHERVVLVVLCRFRIIRKERIVFRRIGRTLRTREVETEASSRTECHRIVERTPFQLVCGHDVPAPPTAVIQLRLVEHLHARDDHRAIQGIQLIRGTLASRGDNRRIHQQSHDTAYRRTKTDQDIR